MTKKPQWKMLSREQQDLYVKILWEDSYTHEAIADFLGTTKGTIVGRQQRHPDIDAPNRARTDRKVNPKRFHDLLDLYELERKNRRA